MRANSVLLEDIHRLRGVAILFVVATHCYSFFGWSGHPLLEAMAKDLFDDSTVIFVFISGYLFHHLETTFAYREYLQRKLFNVWLPYLIAATPAIAYALLRGTHSFDDPELHDLPTAAKVLYLLSYGGSTMNYPLWFIPVVTLYYLAAPALHALGKASDRQLLGVLAVLLPLSLLMHRPTYSHGHNLTLALYFLSAYVMGMCCSRYREMVQGFLGKHLIVFLLLIGALYCGHLLLSDHHGKYTTNEPFEHQEAGGLIDWIFLQKMLLTLVMWELLRRMPERAGRVLHVLGGFSFTIFFFHIYVIILIEWFAHFQTVLVQPAYFVALLVVSVAIPSCIALGFKRALPRWSRSLVGA